MLPKSAQTKLRHKQCQGLQATRGRPQLDANGHLVFLYMAYWVYVKMQHQVPGGPVGSCLHTHTPAALAHTGATDAAQMQN